MTLQSMTALLNRAKDEAFAVPQPDFVNLTMAFAYLEAASKCRSPIILGFGDAYIGAAEAVDLKHLVQMVETLASRYDIPVVLHLDHGSSYEACAKAIEAGFTSVMIDGSALSLEDNVRLTTRVVEYARRYDVSVEGELGRLKTGEGYDLSQGEEQVLTDPEAASTFVRKTGVDAIAVSIGTVHGEYRGEPNIRLDLLKQIREAVPVPLVLHGASGTADHLLSACVRGGITKVNIYTDLAKVINAALHNRYAQTVKVHIPDVLQNVHHAIIEKLGYYMNVLGSVNRA